MRSAGNSQQQLLSFYYSPLGKKNGKEAKKVCGKQANKGLASSVKKRKKQTKPTGNRICPKALASSLNKEIAELLSQHFSRSTGEVITEEHRNGLMRKFEVFNGFVAQKYSDCPRKSLRDFTEEQAKQFKKAISKGGYYE